MWNLCPKVAPDMLRMGARICAAIWPVRGGPELEIWGPNQAHEFPNHAHEFSHEFSQKWPPKRGKFTRKIHAMKKSREKFTRKIHATDVSRMHFAWENGTLKLQAGPGPPHGENSREKFTRNSRDEVPPFGTLFLTLIFEPRLGRPGSSARKIHAQNSRDASGHSCVPFSITFGPCFLVFQGRSLWCRM